jgi:AsmA family
MMEDVQVYKKRRLRLWLALALLVFLLAVVVMPPMVSISRYKSRITQLMSESLGRPVRLSSVELRLLPRPGFVLTDLVVEEDPAFGAEPVLRANTVTASIRLMSLWRGRLEISTISVDEASLNLVRTAEGRWNLDPLFRTAAAKAQPKAGSATDARNPRPMPLPYLEATNSRINFKADAEKLPFSLVNTDLSFWQEQPGDWRIRLRGQPARTDVNLDLADTGIVRLEARAQRAPELRQMPIHLDMEWQEAQLGQLTRLLIGSDPGWRGALTGELHLDGTAEVAEIKTRLRAAGVHRAEFAPAAPLDFDASCGFLYHYSERAVENLLCDSPLGDGRVRVSGGLAGNGGSPQFSVELDRIPVEAGLDALRTVRSDFAPGLEARGSISGKISYAAVSPQVDSPEKQTASENRHKSRSTKARQVPAGPLTGSLSVQGFQLAGDGLNTPLQVSRLVLEPAAIPPLSRAEGHRPSSDQPLALEATVAIPAGGPTPLAITARMTLSGYQVAMHGQASVVRARELAHLAGMANAAALDALAGEPVTVDLGVEGPWQPPQNAPFANIPAAIPFASAALDEANTTLGEKPRLDADGPPVIDSLHGSIEFHNANWKADYLASHVEIEQATLHLGNGKLRWDPVIFSYGPVKGTASLDVPTNCGESHPCSTSSPITFKVQFDDLDASVLQAAILGAHEPGTLLSTLIAQLRPSSSSTGPVWPALEGTVSADSLILGPVTLTDATATLRILDSGAEINGLDADLLGGHVDGSGTLHTAGADQGKPSYTLEGHFEKLNPAEVGQLLGLNWSGRTFDADGKIELSGFTDKDLASSAKGTLSFDWRRGAVITEDSDPSTTPTVPPALARFDRWTADAEIANGTITLKSNQVQQGSHKRTLGAMLTLGDPPKLSFSLPRETQPKETQARR